MKKIPFRTRLHLLIVLTLLVLTLTTVAVGKYVGTAPVFSSKIVLTARLADGVVLQEHLAVRQADGTYVLSEELVSSNTYTLIPGVDIPKDPYIVITGKTNLKAKLYIEIVDTLDTVKIGGNDKKLISYSLTSDWKASTRSAQHGGSVYEYSTTLDEKFKSNPIYILEDNKIEVSQYVKSHNITADSDTDVLTIYAYLEQVPANN